MNGIDFATKRRARGLKQEDIETITGIPQATISRFENGAVQLGELEISRLVDALAYRQTLSRDRSVRPNEKQSVDQESLS